MEKKGWKTMAIVMTSLFVIMAVVSAIYMVSQNKKPKWSFESFSGGIAKIKFGKKTYDYTTNATGTDFVIGTGRYTLQVWTTFNADGTVSGAKGQLFDAKNGQPVDSPLTIG